MRLPELTPINLALIFDMDGTMIDSMPYHAQSWVAFAQAHGLRIDVDDLLRRTTGRTVAECMHDLFQRDIAETEIQTLMHEKEQLYRAPFAPVFAKIAGFKMFSQQAHGRGLKVGVGTAGDQHNIAFAFSHLQMQTAPHAVVGGDEGLPGKPDPTIFLEATRRMNTRAEACIIFEDAPFGIEAARRAAPHVLASVRDYNELINSKFLENLHVATS